MRDHNRNLSRHIILIKKHLALKELLADALTYLICNINGECASCLNLPTAAASNLALMVHASPKIDAMICSAVQL